MTPAFGVANLTTFSFSVSASDPDGDSITTLWDIAGNPFTGTSGQVLFTTGGNGTARVTVNDGKGGTATDSRTFIVGTMTGTWDGFNSSLGAFSMTLTQNGAFFSGTYSDTSPFGQGRTDPAQPGIIRADASLEVRIKQAAFTDFTFRGTMDNTGRRISGGIHGSGFTGQPFVMDKR